MNFKEICRTCLRSGEMLSPLFNEEIEPTKHTVADLLAMFTSVQVDKEDDFPHNICDNCLKEIQQAYLFDLKCKKSEIILHQLRKIRANLEKLNEILIQNDIVCDVAGELESILKEDFKLENIMNLCNHNISDSESNAHAKIGSVEEENSNQIDKSNLRIVEEECIRDFQLVFKRESDHENQFINSEPNEKKLERIEIVSNFQIVEEDYDLQITMKQELDQNSHIIRNNAVQNELELNQNSSNLEIFDEYAPSYQVISNAERDQVDQVISNAERDQNNLVIKDNKNEDEFEFSEVSSNFQVAEEKCVPDFHVTFKSEPELDIGIDCYDEQLKCSDCLKQFHSLDMFRRHIVSDHLEENVCKLCNEEFECSQSEHSAKHLPFNEPENPSGSSEESIRQTENKDESLGKPDFQCKICSKVFVHSYRLVNHMRTHTGENPFDCELCPAKFENSRALRYHKRTKHTDELISDDKPVPNFQCSLCCKVFGHKYQLKNHMLVHTGEKPFQLCPEKFQRNDVLKIHMQTKHANEKPFDCKFCSEKFRNSTALLYHKRTKHTDELISDDKPVPDFQCSVCYKVFGLKSKLRDHMRLHTGEKPFDCKLCSEKFGNNRTLLYHRRTKHTDELISEDKPVPDFKCNVCYKVFGLKFLLVNHMRTHTGEKPFDCELCPEKFGSSRTLLIHKRIKHTDEMIGDDKPVPDFQCSICYKVFGMKYLLRNHMRLHTGEKPFQCKLCPEKFTKSSQLLCHRRTNHTDELISDVPDFQCSVCFKVFGMKYLLRNHMRVHTGEKPFQCKLCPEKFKKNIQLLCHRRTNHIDELISDIPGFKCSVCFKVFGQKYLLRYHMRVHTGEKPFQCKLCPENFRQSIQLLSHRRTNHADQLISDAQGFQCSACDKIFGLKCLLKRHMRVHTGEKPFQCKLCPEKFINSGALLCHRRTKHTDELIDADKPVPDFQCSICHKVFGYKSILRNHMRTHTGEKPFFCELCPEKFGNSRALQCHRRTKHAD